MMTEQQATKLAALLNGKLKQRVSDDVFNALGVRAYFVADWQICSGRLYLTANEERVHGYSATRAQLTTTPLLCAMFEDASLYIIFWIDANLNKLVGDVSINYTHSNNKGRNGLSDIARLVIDLNDIVL